MGSSMLEKTDGVVIKTQDYRETHKIVTLFSKKLGKISTIARGSNRPKSQLAAITQPFVFGHYLIYVSRGLSTMQQGEMIKMFRSIRHDIYKTAYVSYMMELTDKLLEQRRQQLYLYDQFIKTIQWIEDHEGEESYINIPIFMYELKLYTYAGFAPVVDQCVHCQQKQVPLHAFSLSLGGLLCESCLTHDRSAYKVSYTMGKLLYIFKHKNLEQIGNISMKEENITLLRKLLNAYYDMYGSYYIKSRNFLKQLDHLK